MKLTDNTAELEQYCIDLWCKPPVLVLLLEGYLAGELYTLETLGDGERLEVLGGFKVTLSPLPITTSL